MPPKAKKDRKKAGSKSEHGRYRGGPTHYATAPTVPTALPQSLSSEPMPPGSIRGARLQQRAELQLQDTQAQTAGNPVLISDPAPHTPLPMKQSYIHRTRRGRSSDHKEFKREVTQAVNSEAHSPPPPSGDISNPSQMVGPRRNLGSLDSPPMHPLSSELLPLESKKANLEPPTGITLAAPIPTSTHMGTPVGGGTRSMDETSVIATQVEKQLPQSEAKRSLMPSIEVTLAAPMPTSMIMNKSAYHTNLPRRRNKGRGRGAESMSRRGGYCGSYTAVPSLSHTHVRGAPLQQVPGLPPPQPHQSIPGQTGGKRMLIPTPTPNLQSYGQMQQQQPAQAYGGAPPQQPLQQPTMQISPLTQQTYDHETWRGKNAAPVDNPGILVEVPHPPHCNLFMPSLAQGGDGDRKTTPLHEVAESGNVDTVRLLIDKGADINIQETSWNTPLHKAAKSRNADTLRFLIDKGADVNIRDISGTTLLHEAAKSGNADTLRFLIDKGADVNIRDISGTTPLYKAAGSGNADTVRLLIEKGADVNLECSYTILREMDDADLKSLLIEKEVDFTMEGYFQATPLHVAAKSGNVDTVRLLIEKGADIHVEDRFCSTPLHEAVKSGTADTARFLIDKGADFNIMNDFEKTPLHDAAKEGNADIVRLLIEKGACVNNKGRSGITPLHDAAKEGNADIVRLLIEKGADIHVEDRFCTTPLHEAAVNGIADVVRLLTEKGAGVNIKDIYGTTPLYKAAKRGNADTVRLLIEKGAGLNIKSNNGTTPLHAAVIGNADTLRVGSLQTTPIHEAAKIGNADTVRLLIEKGADINIKDNLRTTPLHEAARFGNADAVRLLIEKGAVVNIKDDFGMTPLHMANEKLHKNIEKYLVDHGADVNMKDGDEELTIHFEEAMKNGYVECTMTTCAVTGAAGSGKSHTMYLVLNEDPPDVRQSTGLVEPVRALSTVVGSSESGSSEWSRVDEDKLLGIVVGATSVTDAGEQPMAQTSPSPPAPSISEESFSTSLQLATPQNIRTQVQPKDSTSPPACFTSESSSTSLPPATPSGRPDTGTPPSTFPFQTQDASIHATEQQGTSSKADISEQVSKSETASHTKVVDEQLIKLAGLLKKPVGKRRVTKLDFLYFLDSGGQPQFHELLPSFIPNLSTILFVLKLSEKLSERPEIEYYQEGKLLRCYNSPYSHEQILKHCIRALQPEKKSTESSSPSSPHVAVVGTHRDQESLCEGETREEKNQKLLDLLQPRFGDSLIFYHQLKELIFPVNAKNPIQVDREVARELREATIRSSTPAPVQIPLPWFMLEQVLRKLAKEKGTGVMHIDECRKIASRLHIQPHAFDAALKYLVSLNVFLYYPELLPNVVFCVPQVVLDKINELVERCHILCGRSSILPGGTGSTSTRGLSGKRWIRFQDYGIFQEKLLHDKAFCTHYDKDLFTPADFLKLLESLLIAGKVNTTDINTEYVMPSLLFELESDKLDKHRCDPVNSPAAPLLVHFLGEWPASGVFCSFLASLLSAHKWEVSIDSKNKPTCLYKNCCEFLHPEMMGKITVIDSFDQGYFEVHVHALHNECKKYCPKILQSVFNALPPKAPVTHEVAFFCPKSKRDVACPSSLHLACILPQRNYWRCTENQGEVYGSLSEAANMTVWGITGNTSSEPQVGCQNPTAGAPTSQYKLSKRPTLCQLLKLPCKERYVDISAEIGSEYRKFGILLLEDDNGLRIRDIANQHRDDGKKIAYEILQEWLVGKGKQPVTWQTLIEVLKDAEFSELSNDIELMKC